MATALARALPATASVTATSSRRPVRQGLLPSARTASSARVGLAQRSVCVRASDESASSNTVTTTTSTPESDADAVLSVELDTEACRRTVALDQVNVGDEKITYIAGVALGSEAESAGLVPGQKLIALTHPVNKGEWWTMEGNERLRFVRDAINTRRTPTVTLRVSKAPLDMEGSYQDAQGRPVGEGAAAAEDKTEEETMAEKMEAQYAARQAQQAAATRVVEREREDLYTDNWAGDEYVGSGWNELSVGLGLAIATPLIGLAIAAATYGKSWGVSQYYM